MSNDTPALRERLHGFSSQQLAKELFKADIPEQFIRSLPAQSLFLAIKYNGLSSSADAIQIATPEQCRLLLDFDCWNKDKFDEERFWDWLSLADDEDGLIILQKILAAIDLKIVGLLISRHVSVITREEPSETPPQDGHYTPDKGYTWIGIKAENETHHFLLGRFLALIFETNADLFYQLLSTPGVATDSVLEEDAFQDRTKRLTAEGIPDRELAAEIHAPFSDAALKLELSKTTERSTFEEVTQIEPLIYDSLTPQPLLSLLDSVRDQEAFEGELTYLMNAALIYWDVAMGDPAQISLITRQVKGAINIGLERALKLNTTMTSQGVYEQVGLVTLYRLGVSHLVALRSRAQKVPLEGREVDERTRELILACRHRLPYAPAFFFLEGSFESSAGAEKLDTSPSAIMANHELDKLKEIIQNSQQQIQ